MTIQTALPTTLGTAFRILRTALGNAGIPDQHIEAALILSHCLKLPYHCMYLWPDHPIGSGEMGDLNTALNRRLNREPLAYILGHQAFYDIDLVVGHGVLLPRPETELIVDRILALPSDILGSNNLTIAEAGTGSGAIAICLAKHIDASRIYATDISRDALHFAACNIRRFHLEDRVKLLHGDLLVPIPQRVDIIAANLPYLATDRLSDIQPEVCWEPREALDGGANGVQSIERLLEQSITKIRQGGTIVLEIEVDQGHYLKGVAENMFPNATIYIEQDLAHNDRILILKLRS